MKKLSCIAILATLIACENIQGSIEQQKAAIDKSTENIIKALHLVALKDCANINEQAQIAAIAQSMFAQAHAAAYKLQNQSSQKDAWDISDPLDMTNFKLPSFTMDELPSPTSIIATPNSPSSKHQKMTLRNRNKK